MDAPPANPYLKHLPGKHNQAAHSHGGSSAGGGGGGAEMTGEDMKLVTQAMSKRTARITYNEGYDAGKTHAEGFGEGGHPSTMANHEQKLGESLKGLRSSDPTSMEGNAHAENVLVEQGFLDGARGAKRRLRMTLTGSLNPLYTTPAFGKSLDDTDELLDNPYVVKHLSGKHDQASHGRGGRAITGGAFNGVPRPGMGDDVGMSDDDYNALLASASGVHVVGRAPNGAPIWTPERQAMHDKWVEEEVAGVPKSDNPTVHMLGGGPASGKSTMTEAAGDIPNTDGRNGAKQAVLADVDKQRVKIPEYQDGLASGGEGRAVASSVHPEASYVNKRVTAAAMERDKNVVIDGTGDSGVASVSKKIDEARKHGYTVVGHYATCSTSEAVQRAAKREQATGRGVPSETLRSTHRNVSQIFPEVASKFDRVRLYDTGGKGRARLVASAVKDAAVSVHNADLYDKFLAKAKE